jgi:hypothetical protein
MMSGPPGYPLPAGDLGEDNLVCQLVYLPDRPEYWQAFLGALHYMTTWRAWERDADKRGKDAASNWREAFELTIGCWRMTCLQDLQDDVAAILAIMEMGNPCCDDQDITGGDRYTDRVEDGEGDVPQNIIDAGYADDAADWAGFDDYKCMVSHVIVAQLDARLLEIAPIVNQFGMVFGGAIALAGILGAVFSAGSIAFIYGLVAATGTVGALYANLLEGDLLVVLAGKVSDNHDQLACAVYQSDGDVDALVALNAKIDELFAPVEAVIVKSLNLGPTLKALYAGRYNQQDIAAELEEKGYDVGSFDCTCDYPVGEYREIWTWDVDDDWLGWSHGTGDSIHGDGNPNYAPRCRYDVPPGYCRIDMDFLADHIGIANPSNRIWAIYSIELDYKHDLVGTGQASIQTRTTGGAGWIANNYPNSLTYVTVKKDWGDETPRELQYTGGINLRGLMAAGGGYTHFDNVKIDFDTWLT